MLLFVISDGTMRASRTFSRQYSYRHSSVPVVGSYEVIKSAPIVSTSGLPLWSIGIGVVYASILSLLALVGRGCFQSVSPVFGSTAITNDSRGFSSFGLERLITGMKSLSL